MGSDYRIPTGQGETDSILGGNKQNVACTKTQGKGAVTPQGLNQTYLLVWEGPMWRCGSAVACYRDGGTGGSSLGRFPLVWVFLEVISSPTIKSVDSKPGLLQAKQLTVDNWISFTVCGPPTWARHRFSHQQSLLTGNLHKPLRLIHQRVDRRSQKYNSTVSRTKTTITDVNQNEKAEL